MDQRMPKCAWPEWELQNKIGQGSYGAVYEAERKGGFGVESHAAIKIVSIPPDESMLTAFCAEGLDEVAIQKELNRMAASFSREIQVLYDLRGAAHIVDVEDYAQILRNDGFGWDFFIRMELLKSLPEYLGNRSMGEQAVVKLGIDLCAALEICASKELIHRDIKPGNIFVSQFGDFKLGDFGIARQMDDIRFGGRPEGTPAYMAPEVKQGMAYGASSDLYSLGLVLYWLMNGQRLPFMAAEKMDQGEREQAIRRRLDGEELPAPSQASLQMCDAILCACAYDPAQRFATATEMRKALERVASGETSVAEQGAPQDSMSTPSAEKPAPCEEETAPNRTRRRGLIATVIVVAVAAVGVGAFFGVRQSRNTRYDELVLEQADDRQAGDAEGEEAAYEEAVSLRPAELASYYQHALTLHELPETDGTPGYQACINFIENDILANGEIDLTQSGMSNVYYLYASSLFQTAQSAADAADQAERYAAAVDAYQTLVDMDSDEALYYRDYAIALAYAGDNGEAQNVLNQAETLGLSDANILYTRGELEQMSGNDDAALEDFSQCIEQTEDENLAAHAYLACADIYEARDDLEMERQMLLAARDLDTTKRSQILQNLVQTDSDLADAAERAAKTAGGGATAQKLLGDASMYRQEAIDTLESILELGWVSFTNYNNLIILYEEEGQIDQADAILEEIRPEYATDYRWYKRLAFLEVEKQVASEEPDYSAFLEAYNQAVVLYQTSGKTDDEMGVLDSQYSEIRSAGWLSD